MVEYVPFWGIYFFFFFSWFCELMKPKEEFDVHQNQNQNKQQGAVGEMRNSSPITLEGVKKSHQYL